MILRTLSENVTKAHNGIVVECLVFNNSNPVEVLMETFLLNLTYTLNTSKKMLLLVMFYVVYIKACGLSLDYFKHNYKSET